MAFVFDPAKDAANLAKHGISLARASEMVVLSQEADPRFSEPRYRAYGRIDGVGYCLAYALRDGDVRMISLRRSRAKEMKRHVR